MKKLVLLLAAACLAGCGEPSDPTSPDIKPPADSLSSTRAGSGTAATASPAAPAATAGQATAPH